VGISAEDFAKITARMSGGTVVGGAATPVVTPRPRRWLGLDPSLRGTGWGVLEFKGREPVLLEFGVLKCPPSWPRSRCLAHIAQSLASVLGRNKPEICAVEALFYAQNQRTTLILGEARGAALSTIAAAGVPIVEMAPRRVKLAVVGYGAAGKPAVGRMVERLLGLAETLPPDAADALAVVLATANAWGRPGGTVPKPL
jgi:crossover junction endodeoxyribonuclease RuvC